MSTELVKLAAKKFSPEETKLLEELTRPGAKIEVTVPGEIDFKEWIKTTNVVCRGLLRAQIQGQKLFPVLGRLLVIAEDHPEIWESHKSFKQFMQTEIQEKFGISPASCYESMQMARRLPHLELAQIESVPRRNMRVFLQVVPSGDEKTSTAKALLVKAAELSEADFREHCEKKNLIEQGQTQGQFIKFGTNKARGKKIEQWFTDPRVQAKAQSERWDVIMELMIAECAGEWLATPLIEEAIKEAQEVA